MAHEMKMFANYQIINYHGTKLSFYLMNQVLFQDDDMQLLFQDHKK